MSSTDTTTTTTTTTGAGAAAAAAAAAASDKKVKLASSDDQEFEVSEDLAKMSATIKAILEDMGDMDAPIPLPNVNGAILNKVIQYCQHQLEHPTPTSDDKKDDDEKASDEMSEWDQEFCKVDQATLFDLILAANYLDIKPLLDVTCKTVAGMIKGKTPEQIRQTFNIKNDFTPEEEEAVRKEMEWAEQP